ncbi:MAG TPA: double zinc ribbon domain-containing protein [Gemmatimonadaceae bacterium]|nr:double zinc ribbon domain-containing protein [Gemmatimonadaceae bacterium]
MMRTDPVGADVPIPPLSARGAPGRVVRLAVRAGARLGRDLLDLALPRCCASCDALLGEREAGLVCGPCWARLVPLPHPRCERCGHPTGGAPCRWCAQLPAYVRAVRSVCWAHRGTGRAVVHALKYHGWERVADGMAERMARLSWPADVVGERRALVPVPLAASRLRERGFNQSERLARALGARLALPVWADVLERSRATHTQTRLTPEQRLSNVSGAFHAPAGAATRLRGAHLLLVDDVVTTAATLNACAATLFGAGARIISYVTFGRAPGPGDRI